MIHFSSENEIQLIVVVSPALVTHAEPSSLESFCRKRNVPFFDNSNPEAFLTHPEWFNDATHMNKIGAERYTTYFIGQLKNIATEYTEEQNDKSIKRL